MQAQRTLEYLFAKVFDKRCAWRFLVFMSWIFRVMFVDTTA